MLSIWAEPHIHKHYTEDKKKQKLPLFAIVHRREIQCYGRYLQLHEQTQQYAMHVYASQKPMPVSIVYEIFYGKCLIKSGKIKLIRSLLLRQVVDCIYLRLYPFAQVKAVWRPFYCHSIYSTAQATRNVKFVQIYMYTCISNFTLPHSVGALCACLYLPIRPMFPYRCLVCGDLFEKYFRVDFYG